VIAGNLIMGEKLSISNKSGNYTITNDGLNATASVYENTYSISINPSTPSQIFNIKINETDAFNIDTNNNRLVMNGEVNASYGNIGGWNISSDGLTSTNTIASINLYNQGNQAMKLSYRGLNLYNHYSGNNEYLGGFMAISNNTNNTNGLLLGHASSAEYLILGYIDSTNPSTGTPVDADCIYTHNGYAEMSSGFNFLQNIYIVNKADLNSKTEITYSGITTQQINGGTPITTNNMYQYLASATHTHSEYATSGSVSFLSGQVGSLTSQYGDLAGRVSALESKVG
jgi:hypothetical protein